MSCSKTATSHVCYINMQYVYGNVGLVKVLGLPKALLTSSEASSTTLSSADRYNYDISDYSCPSAVSMFSNLAPHSPLPLRIFFLHSKVQKYKYSKVQK